MVNRVDLQAALAIDPVYDTAVTSGRNRDLLDLLNTPDPALPKKWLTVERDDFLEIIASETFPAEVEGRIRTYLATEQPIPTDRAAVRQWLQANLSASAVMALKALAEVEGKPSDAFGDEVSLRDLWAVLREIPKSYMAMKLAQG